MVRSRKELQTGWVVSVAFHILVAVLLFYSTFRHYIPEPQFVEMTWGNISSLQSPMPNIPSEKSTATEDVQQSDNADNSVALPSRTYLDLPDEVISIKQNKKNISVDIPSNTARSGKLSAEERRSNIVSSGLGLRENVTGKSSQQSKLQVATPFGSGSESGGLGNNIAYSVQWAGGGNRKLMTGDVPSYPPGVNVSAQIKLTVTVQQDGSVRSVAPAQKGDTRLENAAIGKVKLWKFEPLLSTQPHIEQLCTITFNFLLK